MSQLAFLLRASNRFSLGLQFGRAVCRVLAIALFVALGAAAFDALLGFETWGLVALDATIALSILWGLAWGIRLLVRSRRSVPAVAREIERTLNVSGNRLVTAWEFQHSPPRRVSAALVARAVQEGEDSARELPLARTLPLKVVGRAIAVLMFGVAVAVIGYFAEPELFAAVVPRLLDPTGDHPPYTRVRFEVDTDPKIVVLNKPATIKARLTGPEPVTAANLVFVSQEGRQSMPMLAGQDGQFSLLLASAEQSRDYYIETPRGRSRRFHLDVQAIPAIEEARVSYLFPKFTGWAPTAHPLDIRGIQALTGTAVEITIRSQVPLSRGILEINESDHSADASQFTDRNSPEAVSLGKKLLEIELTPGTDPRLVTGRFTLTMDGFYQISLYSAAGIRGPQELTGSVRTVLDRPPVISLVEPTPQAYVVEGFTVPIKFAAADDVGLERLELHMKINDLGPVRLEPEIERTEAARWSLQMPLDLHSLGAAPGDEIRYYATVKDNSPRNAPVDSPVCEIHVISREEYIEMTRQQVGLEELQEELREFAEQLETLKAQKDAAQEALEELEKQVEEGQPLTPEQEETFKKLQKQLEEFQKAVEELASRAQQRAERDQLYELEEALQKKMAAMAKQLQKQGATAEAVRDALQRLSKRREQPSKEELQELLDQLKEEQQPFDQETLDDLAESEEDMEKLRKADKLLEKADELQSLIKRQRDLADKLGEIKEIPELNPEQQERASQLAKQQDDLQRELEELTNSLEQAAEQAKQDLPKTAADAQRLCKALRDAKIGEDQQQAAEHAREGQGKPAHTRADTAAQKLELLQQQFAPQAGEMAGEGQFNPDSGLCLKKEGAAKSLQQLAGSKPGRKSGQQKSRGQKPGGNSEGSGGEEGKATIIGPHQPSTQAARPKQGQREGRQNGKDSASSMAGLSEAETIDAGTSSDRSRTATQVRGVPLPYRDSAEAFYRRLAEEQAGR